jgi:filamentous hemagglutinin
MSLSSGSLNNTQGAIISNQQLELRAADVNNDAGLLVALQGLDASTGALSNQQGAVQSGADLRWDTQDQALNNAGGLISARNSISLSSGDINNQQGVLTSGGNFTLTGGSLDNRNGQIAGKSDLTLNTADISNQQGSLQALGDMALNAAHAVIDNTTGLILGAQQVLMRASQVINQDTHSDDQSSGIQGGDIEISADSLDNQHGDILANGDASLALTGQLDNSNGLITAMARARLQADSLINSLGDIEAGNNLAIDSASLTGDGKLLSLGDMSIGLTSDFTNTGTLQANGNLDFTTTGNVTNQNLIQAGDTLTLKAASLVNTSSAELSAGTLEVNVSGELNNRGLLDGYNTRLSAQTLNNTGTGRIYGDWLAINAGTLNNSAENGTAATIAARQQLDMGVGTLNNSDHALIYSDGGMYLGGSLDANWQATGQAIAVNNHSATIESAGDMALNVATLNNINDHFTTENVLVSQEHISEYNVDRLGSQLYNDNDYNISMYMDETWIICIEGVICHTTDGDKFTHYDYTRTITEDRVLDSDPGQIIAGGNLTINATEVLNDKSQIVAGGNLNINATNLNNVEVTGERIITDDGTAIRYKRKQSKGGDSPSVKTSAWAPPAIIQDISLNASTVADHSQISGSGLSVDAYQDTSVSDTLQGGGSLSIADIAGPNGASPVTKGPVGSVTIPGINGAPSMSLAPGKTFEVSQPGGSEVVRMVGPNTRIPDNSLFKSHPESNSPYLIETDPRFTNQKQWLSSDYMMQAFVTDPNNIEKRLGDGFYEQRLIREQVVALTGQRYLGDTTSDEEQYKMLMDNGIAFGELYGLKPGVALTAEQMSVLTTDIVWMVSQTVQLPDGSTQQVLVPQVYAKVKAGDLDGSGALLAGRNVNLNLSDDLTNSGRISSKDSTQILANNINNLGGIISGNDVALQARTDINNVGGTIKGGNSLQAFAGRDINVTTTTRSAVSVDGNFGRTSIDRIGSLSVTRDGGVLGLQAGHDINLTAAQISNSGANSQTMMIAGNNLNLGTVTTGSHDNLSWGSDDWLKRSQSGDIGTAIQGGGNVSMGAGHDVNITAGNVSANQQLKVQAGNDLNIVNGTASDSFEQYTRQTGSSSLTSKTTTVDHNLVSNQNAVGSQLDGDSVTLSAGHDVLVRGSDVAATGNVAIQAGHNLTIASAEETSREWHMKKTTKSGLLSSGGTGFTVGTLKETTEKDSQARSSRQSMVGSLQGDTILLAGNDYRQTGSTVSAPVGNVLIQGKNVTIEAAQNTYDSQYRHTVEQNGLTLAVNVPALQALQVAANAVKQTGKSSDDRINMLAAANSAWDSAHAATAMMDSAKAVMANGAQGAAQNVSVSLTYGQSKQTNTETINGTTAQGSKINAGKSAVIVATGGEHSDINIIGSDISGKQGTTLFADNNINIVAAEQQRHDHTDDHSSGWNAGVAVSYGQSGAAFGVTAGGQYGVGNGQGDEATWRNSHVGDVGGLTSITSGDTTTLRGGQIMGKGIQITADNLNIESLQDTMKYQGKQMDMSGQVTVGFGFSASGSLNMSKVNADYASVQEQSGIFAGDDGYQISVNNHTDLKGGIITSNDIAERMGKNQLSTGTLTASDIENHSEFEGKGVGLSGGISVVSNGENGNNSGKTLVGKEMSQGIGYDHGSEDSTTRSGINTGNIVITRPDEQLAITGKTAAEAISAIRTDVSTETAAANSGKLDNNFDRDDVFKELHLQVSVTKEFKDNAYNQIDSYIDSKQADARADLKKAMDNHDDVARDKALDEIYKLQYQRRYLQTVVGVVAGSPGIAITQGTLATAATAMREESVKNSFLFGGAVDNDGRVLSNVSGDSNGLYDGIKIGGVRVGLDFVCGKGNERCQTDTKNDLVYDVQGYVKYIGDTDHPTFDKLLEDKTLSSGLYGPTGGFQGGTGSMGPISYTPGSFFDDLVESYAGTHDLLGGQLPRFYDNSGNTTRGRGSIANLAANTWTIAAIPIATPFAVSELASPELLQFIFSSGK